MTRAYGLWDLINIAVPARLSFFTSSRWFTQTWHLLKYSVLCCHQLTLHNLKRLVSLSETAVGEYTAFFCICVLNVRLTRISACFTKSLTNTVRTVYSPRISHRLTILHKYKDAFPNTNTHRPPRPSPSLTPPHKYLPWSRCLALPHQHTELESKGAIQLHLKDGRERLLSSCAAAT
jgi:hypothetical protein